MEEEKKHLIDRKKMNMLQFMGIIAMLLTMLTGEQTGFAVATAMMCGLKLLSMYAFEDSKEAFFAAIYGGLAIHFFMGL
jgi:uncharacterized membrane protein YobD (UPF0266 family)